MACARYVAHQAYYSLIGRDYEWELMPLALDQKVGAVVWSPLGWGRLTGKIRRGQPLPQTSRLHSKLVTDIGPPVSDEYLYRVVDALDDVARETGKTVPQIALNWLLQRPSVATVIIGARNEEQLRQNLGAVGWNLTAEQVAKLDAASATTLAYPYWHQRAFAERNPPPVSTRDAKGRMHIDFRRIGSIDPAAPEWRLLRLAHVQPINPEEKKVASPEIDAAIPAAMPAGEEASLHNEHAASLALLVLGRSVSCSATSARVRCTR